MGLELMDKKSVHFNAIDAIDVMLMLRIDSVDSVDAWSGSSDREAEILKRPVIQEMVRRWGQEIDQIAENLREQIQHVWRKKHP